MLGRSIGSEDWGRNMEFQALSAWVSAWCASTALSCLQTSAPAAREMSCLCCGFSDRYCYHVYRFSQVKCVCVRAHTRVGMHMHGLHVVVTGQLQDSVFSFHRVAPAD